MLQFNLCPRSPSATSRFEPSRCPLDGDKLAIPMFRWINTSDENGLSSIVTTATVVARGVAKLSAGPMAGP